MRRVCHRKLYAAQHLCFQYGIQRTPALKWWGSERTPCKPNAGLHGPSAGVPRTQEGLLGLLVFSAVERNAKICGRDDATVLVTMQTDLRAAGKLAAARRRLRDLCVVRLRRVVHPPTLSRRAAGFCDNSHARGRLCAHYLFVNVQRRPVRATMGGPRVSTGVRPTS